MSAMPYKKQENRKAFDAMEKVAKAHGWPESFEDDLYKYDRNALACREVCYPFGWILRDWGTFICFPERYNWLDWAKAHVKNSPVDRSRYYWVMPECGEIKEVSPEKWIDLLTNQRRWIVETSGPREVPVSIEEPAHYWVYHTNGFRALDGMVYATPDLFTCERVDLEKARVTEQRERFA